MTWNEFRPKLQAGDDFGEAHFLGQTHRKVIKVILGSLSQQVKELFILLGITIRSSLLATTNKLTRVSILTMVRCCVRYYSSV